uniref:Uncharacterized protein n=1 Tax=Paracidobacterium acidisoli TaxID=2303751 RepID=A0A372IU52_9BACT
MCFLCQAAFRPKAAGDDSGKDGCALRFGRRKLTAFCREAGPQPGLYRLAGFRESLRNFSVPAPAPVLCGKFVNLENTCFMNEFRLSENGYTKVRNVTSLTTLVLVL